MHPHGVLQERQNRDIIHQDRRRKVRRELVLMILLLCSCGPSLPGPAATPLPAIEPEEYAVYSAMIRQHRIEPELGSTIVIEEQTNAHPLDMEVIERVPASVADSYRLRNAAQYALNPNLDIEQDYALMPRYELDKGGFEAWFKASYPSATGWLTFSRVGICEKGNKALVFMSFNCGEGCGEGGLYLLDKKDGTWLVRERLFTVLPSPSALP
jgi:hypothetical protein